MPKERDYICAHFPYHLLTLVWYHYSLVFSIISSVYKHWRALKHPGGSDNFTVVLLSFPDIKSSVVSGYFTHFVLLLSCFSILKSVGKAPTSGLCLGESTLITAHQHSSWWQLLLAALFIFFSPFLLGCQMEEFYGSWGSNPSLWPAAWTGKKVSYL